MFTLNEIVKISEGRLIGGAEEAHISGISTDTRTLTLGELFVALKGPHFDGHRFLNQAHQKGAVCALVSEEIESPLPIIVVSDTLKALQILARSYRSRFAIPVVAVTGSVGKTTTKECIAVTLSEVFNVRVGFGNWNNHIGVPANLFRLSPEDQCLVLELGANHPGEIKQLSEIAQPTVGVITAIHPVHLEGFGSLQGVYQAKLELADFLDQNFGTIIANGDDPELMRRLKNRKCSVITFGTSKHCDYRLTDLFVNDGTIYFKVNDKFEFRLNGYGAFNAPNALAAVAVAGYFNLDLNSLSESWQSLPIIQGRFRTERLEAQNIIIVDDSYNANPISVKQAVQSFAKLASERRKLLVIGDMLELGAHSGIYHEDLGHYLAEFEIDFLVGVGPMSQLILRAFSKAERGGKTVHFQTAQEAARFLVSHIQENDAVFIKGSHGVHLEQIKPLLIQAIETAALV
jgi:UDP-N-acetylmuramoyl-tripeptide--D-alanyl-D-alanine ligase